MTLDDGAREAICRPWMPGLAWAGQDSNLDLTDYESAALTD
jgi:hypothetical protein